MTLASDLVTSRKGCIAAVLTVSLTTHYIVCDCTGRLANFYIRISQSLVSLVALMAACTSYSYSHRASLSYSPMKQCISYATRMAVTVSQLTFSGPQLVLSVCTLQIITSVTVRRQTTYILTLSNCSHVYSFPMMPIFSFNWSLRFL